MRKKISDATDAIRNAYAEKGVADFYVTEGHRYHNPHEPQVSQLVKTSIPWWSGNSVWDLCCGSGEVTRAIQETIPSASVFATDPYTLEAFKKQHPDIPNADWTFESIAKGIARGKSFDAIYCSFALHLCPENWLYQVCNELFNIAPLLIVITPHKRPELEQYADFKMVAQSSALTRRGKQVFAKAYERAWTSGERTPI